MRFSDAPYLSMFTNGATLRTLATKVQSRAAMAWRNGDEAVGPRIAAFWTNQKTLMDNQWGHPTDGEYLGIGYNDMRKACYKVQSELRMNPGAAKKAELVEFIDYLINAGKALTNKGSQVAAGKNGIV